MLPCFSQRHTVFYAFQIVPNRRSIFADCIVSFLTFFRMAIEINCPPGTYSGAAAYVCTVCPAGTECPTATSSPSNCPPGEFSTGNQAQCTKCPKGHACPNTTTDDTIKCSPGFYSLGGKTQCTPCRAG